MGQTHRTFHRQTQPTHHLLNFHPPLTLSSRPEARFLRRSGEIPALAFSQPTSTSVISTGAQRSGETPVLALAHPTPKRCHLDRRRAFAPQRRDPYVLFSSNHRNPCHFDRSVAQWRNPRIGSPSPRQNPVGISSKPTPPQTPSSRLPTLSSRPKARFCAAVERPPHWLFPNPPPPLSFRPERSAVEKPPYLFSLIPPNLCHLDRRRAFCAAVERPPHWLFPNPPPPLSFRPERSAVEKPPYWLSFTRQNLVGISSKPTPPQYCHLDPPHPCHLDRRRAFAPQRRDPCILFSSNHRNPCHFDRSAA